RDCSIPLLLGDPIAGGFRQAAACNGHPFIRSIRDLVFPRRDSHLLGGARNPAAALPTTPKIFSAVRPHAAGRGHRLRHGLVISKPYEGRKTRILLGDRVLPPGWFRAVDLLIVIPALR